MAVNAVPARSYGALALVGDAWVLGGLEPHVVIKLKALFPQIPKTLPPPYRFANTGERCADLAWFAERYPLGMTAEDRRALRRGREAHVALAAELERIKADVYAPPDFAGVRPGQEVRPHQAKAATILQRVGGLLVGDDTGEGKTYTAGACLLLPGALPGVVVCLPHLKRQWREKIEAFTTLTCHTVQGTRPYPLPPSDVRIFGYTQLAGWADVLELFGCGLAVFDEMQELRRGDMALKGQAARRLVSIARMKLGLTATPIYNYGDEMWDVMRFLRPEVLGEREDFIREWCTTLSNGRSRVTNPKALGSYLRDANAFTRKVKDRQGVPNIIVRSVDHNALALASIEALAADLAQTATSGSFSERGQAVRELDLQVRHATGVAKAPYVAAFVRLLVEAGEAVIVCGWHRDVYDIWLRELADLAPAMFTGSETPARKEEQKRRFLDGETGVFIMSLRSGAGVDGLQARCSTVVFGELDWSPGIHHQCVGRLDREGQICWPDPVNAIYLVASDGSDPSMMETLGLKRSEAVQIVDPALGVQKAASDDSHLRSLVNRYLRRRAA
jgi:SNF2-related domain